MKHYTDEELIDYLHGELPDALDVRLHAHLADCGDCRTRCETETAVSEMLRASSLGAQRDFPPAIRARVWASIRAAEPTPLERLRAVLSPVLAIPFAVAAALLLYLGVPVLRGTHATGAPTVSALYYLEEHAAEGQENPLADHVSTNVTLDTPSSAAIADVPLVAAADAATLDDVVAARR